MSNHPILTPAQQAEIDKLFCRHPESARVEGPSWRGQGTEWCVKCGAWRREEDMSGRRGWRQERAPREETRGW